MDIAQDIANVHSFTFLETTVSASLKWDNLSGIIKKFHQKLQQQLKKFGVSKDVQFS